MITDNEIAQKLREARMRLNLHKKYRHSDKPIMDKDFQQAIENIGSAIIQLETRKPVPSDIATELKSILTDEWIAERVEKLIHSYTWKAADAGGKARLVANTIADDLLAVIQAQGSVSS